MSDLPSETDEVSAANGGEEPQSRRDVGGLKERVEALEEESAEAVSILSAKVAVVEQAIEELKQQMGLHMSHDNRPMWERVKTLQQWQQQHDEAATAEIDYGPADTNLCPACGKPGEHGAIDGDDIAYWTCEEEEAEDKKEIGGVEIEEQEGAYFYEGDNGQRIANKNRASGRIIAEGFRLQEENARLRNTKGYDANKLLNEIAELKEENKGIYRDLEDEGYCRDLYNHCRAEADNARADERKKIVEMIKEFFPVNVMPVVDRIVDRIEEMD